MEQAFMEATLENARQSVRDLCSTLKLPSLETYGLKREDFPQLVEKSSRSSSMKGNPVKLADAELTGILESATGSG